MVSVIVFFQYLPRLIVVLSLLFCLLLAAFIFLAYFHYNNNQTGTWTVQSNMAVVCVDLVRCNDEFKM